MKTYKFILVVIFILSLSLNAAFLINLLTSAPSHADTQENLPELNLTTQQKKQMEPIRLKIHKDNEAVKKQILHCQEKLLTALNNETVNKQAIYQCIDNINNLQKKIQQNTVEEILLVKKYMDPHQCNCLIKGLGAAMQQKTKPCNCPDCSLSHKKKEK